MSELPDKSGLWNLSLRDEKLGEHKETVRIFSATETTSFDNEVVKHGELFVATAMFTQGFPLRYANPDIVWSRP